MNSKQHSLFFPGQRTLFFVPSLSPPFFTYHAIFLPLLLPFLLRPTFLCSLFFFGQRFFLCSPFFSGRRSRDYFLSSSDPDRVTETTPSLLQIQTELQIEPSPTTSSSASQPLLPFFFGAPTCGTVAAARVVRRRPGGLGPRRLSPGDPRRLWPTTGVEDDDQRRRRRWMALTMARVRDEIGMVVGCVLSREI